jgi:hypothetical protein
MISHEEGIARMHALLNPFSPQLQFMSFVRRQLPLPPLLTPPIN